MTDAEKKVTTPLKGDYTATFTISQLGDEVFATVGFDPLITSPEIAKTPAYAVMSDVIEYYLWRIGVINDEGVLVHPEAISALEDFDISQIAGNEKIN